MEESFFGKLHRLYLVQIIRELLWKLQNRKKKYDQKKVINTPSELI